MSVAKAPLRCFCIGDIHGFSKSLVALIEKLDKESGLNPNDLLVFLGDLVDRGPNDNGVLNIVMTFERHRSNTKVILENHDAWLIKDKRCPPATQLWLRQRPHYYRWRNFFFSHAPVYRVPGSEMLDRIPQAYWGGFNAFDEAIAAGYDFLSPFQGFDADDLVNESGVVGVCGHVHHDDVIEYDHYIGVDTGCGFGGKLSAIELPSRRVFSVPELR